MQPIHPRGPHNDPRLSAQPGERTSGAHRAPEAAGAAASSPRQDRVELSAASRALAAQQADQAVPDSTLEPARRADVLQRLEGGFYDRPEVRDAIAQQLVNDLDA